MAKYYKFVQINQSKSYKLIFNSKTDLLQSLNCLMNPDINSNFGEKSTDIVHTYNGITVQTNMPISIKETK